MLLGKIFSRVENSSACVAPPGEKLDTFCFILAKLLGYSFVDTDLVIQKKEGKLLKHIISEKGIEGFIETENRVLSELNAVNSVISTGGSVVYGKEAMKNLSENGIVVYLKLDYNKLKYRLHNIKNNFL